MNMLGRVRPEMSTTNVVLLLSQVSWPAQEDSGPAQKNSCGFHVTQLLAVQGGH